MWLCKIMNEYGKRPFFAEFFLRKIELNTSITIQEIIKDFETPFQ
jgi:hypothetical protein